jgi:D-glycero-D-manno-heptose 1,7-bisphosphate phosphatase
MRPALFLDRDGVIVDEAEYLADPAKLCLLPGSAEAIVEVNRQGVPVIVVTNQSGVARGYFPESRVAEIHVQLDRLLAGQGAHISRYYYCPHHPTEGQSPYRVDCQCRKPRPGMLLQAARDLSLELHESFLVGDKLSDLEAGASAGCQTILVRTGYGGALADTLEPQGLNLEMIADDLREAVRFCLPRLMSALTTKTRPTPSTRET